MRNGRTLARLRPAVHAAKVAYGVLIRYPRSMLQKRKRLPPLVEVPGKPGMAIVNREECAVSFADNGARYLTLQPSSRR